MPTPELYTSPSGIEFILCPAGTFMMGSESGLDWEKPAHQVTITRPYYIAKYPVTQAQWKAVMGSEPSKFLGKDYPVEMVSWDGAQAFIKKLNETEGTTLYRLPTSAEWEYAARAGTETEYFWGDDAGMLGEYAWYWDNSGAITHSVGKKKANPWGVHDIYGNVWEWVEDWHGAYTAEARTDPRGPETGSERVTRGAGYTSFAKFFRSASRFHLAPGSKANNVGFRLARSVE